MKTTLLSTVAAAALAISFGAASAQNMERGGAASGGAEKSAPAAMEKSAPAAGAERGAASESKSEQAPKAGAAQQAQVPSKMESNKAAEGSKMESGKAAEGKAATDNKSAQAPASSNSKMSEDKAATERPAQKTGDAGKADSKSGTAAAESSKSSTSKSTVGAASSTETKMTTEQRTQIREKVLATGPKVDHVNFSLNVGTVVPRDVRIVEVPTVIIDLHPDWRGYRYFVVGDQIVVVEPGSLRIVAILDV